MLIKAIIFIVLAVIVGSLASALYQLVNDKGRSKRMAKALTLRIALSVLLFLFLILGYYTGLIEPNVPANGG